MENKPLKIKPQAPSAKVAALKFYELIPKTNIDFIKWGPVFYALSGAVILTALGMLIFRGIPLGVEFKGGVSVQFEMPSRARIDDIRKAFVEEGLDNQLQSLGQEGQYLAKFKREEEESGLDNRLEKVFTQLAGGEPYHILSKDFVGAVVGEKLRQEAALAILLSFLGIIVYVGFRFRNLIWGVAGVAAVMHDVFLSLGFLTLCGFEVDLVVVAALLTLAGYSINDTVVIFDRLRERIRVYPRENLRDAINRAVNDTLSRTFLTAGATFLSVLSLAALGGMNLRPFSIILMFGIIVGSYSTIGVASNLVYTWANWTGIRAR